MSNLFFAVECLTEGSKPLHAQYLHRKFFKAAEKRNMAQTLQKFVEINRRRFAYLGIIPHIQGIDNSLSISFTTSNYIGSVPLLSPITGKNFADFSVFPRFTNRTDAFKEYTELIQVVGETIGPEFDYTLDLNGALDYRPPLYYESVKFIHLLNKVLDRPWQKFSSLEVCDRNVRGNINWAKKIQKDYDVNRRLQFPTKTNTLSEDHEDLAKAKYVLAIAKDAILAAHTPLQIRATIRPILSKIDIRLNPISTIATQEMFIRRSDFSSVVDLKTQANVLLKQSLRLNKAWRIDYSKVYEKAVQYIFAQAGKQIGARIYNNQHFTRTSSSLKSSWGLDRLEPDIVVSKGKITQYADAKYKAHLLNTFSQSEGLKEEFRRDLHQVCAYSSFSDQKNKTAFLCYPSNVPYASKTSYINRLNGVEVSVFMLGISLKTIHFKSTIEKTKSVLEMSLEY